MPSYRAILTAANDDDLDIPFADVPGEQYVREWCRARYPDYLLFQIVEVLSKP